MFCFCSLDRDDSILDRQPVCVRQKERVREREKERDVEKATERMKQQGAQWQISIK